MESKTNSLFDEIIRVKNSKKASKNPKKTKSLAIQSSHPLLKHIFSNDSLAPKTTLNTNKEQSSQTLSQKTEHISKDYSFEGKLFYFPFRDIQLTNTRCQIFSNIICKRGGTVIKNDSQLDIERIDYFVINKNLGKYSLKQKLLQKFQLPKMSKGINLNSCTFIDFNYIIECEKYGKQVRLDDYIFDIQQKCGKRSEQLGQPSKKVHKCNVKQQKNEQTQAQAEAEEEIQLSQTCSCFSKTMSVKIMPNTNQCSQDKIVYTQKKVQPDKNKFACVLGSRSLSFQTNQFICDQLMKIQAIYQNGKDVGRKIAYLKAVSAIKAHHKQITSQKDLIEVRGIGVKIMEKIKQLLQTGSIQKLHKLQNCEQNGVYVELGRVWGIGASKAKQLFEKGIKDMNSLRENQNLLNKNQKIGLKYLEQFQKRIPRTKVASIFEYVKLQIDELSGSPGLHKVEVCGSYRRGKQSCGDIDIIISRRDGVYDKNFLIDLIFHLEKQGFITDHLSIPSEKNNNDKSLSYMGVCVFQDQIHHRIDIKYYPLQQFAFAILYFTGSDMFNRSMRLLARKKGYSLSDHGICPVQRNCKSERIWKGTSIAFYTEQEIFDFLGLQYKLPQQRNI